MFYSILSFLWISCSGFFFPWIWSLWDWIAVYERLLKYRSVILSQWFSIELLELTALSSSEFKRIHLRTQRDRQKARNQRRKRESLDATRSICQSKAALIDFFLCVCALKCEGMHTRAQKQGRISQNLKCPPNPLNPTPTALRKSRKTLKRRVSGNTVSTPVPVSIRTSGMKLVLLCPSDPELLSCLSGGFKESSESFIAKWASPH